MVADVSAVADPNTGVAVYDTYGSTNGANWYVFGGTSVASPIVASVYALAGNAASTVAGSYPYSHKTYDPNPGATLFDVTSGSNGGGCKRIGTYLCNAATGYDGPTGLGTPDGTSAF
jgi:subtilase family serine protease